MFWTLLVSHVVVCDALFVRLAFLTDFLWEIGTRSLYCSGTRRDAPVEVGPAGMHRLAMRPDLSGDIALRREDSGGTRRDAPVEVRPVGRHR